MSSEEYEVVDSIPEDTVTDTAMDDESGDSNNWHDLVNLDLYQSEHEMGGALLLSEINRIRLYTSNGSVSVIGWDRSDFRATLWVKVRAADADQARARARRLFKFQLEPGLLLMDGTAFRKFNESLAIELYLPQEVCFDLEARSSNGAVTLFDANTGNTSLKSSNGGLRFRDGSATSLEMITSNGSIECQGKTEDLHATTTNGSLSLTISGKGRFEMSSVNGAITVEVPAAQGLAHDLDLRSSMGRVSVELPDYHNSVSFSPFKGNPQVQTRSPGFDHTDAKYTLRAKTNLGSITILS